MPEYETKCSRILPHCNLNQNKKQNTEQNHECFIKRQSKW